MVNLTYGKSMYGGWYANDESMTINLHTERLKDLQAYCEKMGYVLMYRRDN